ncbi:hypothetical protein TorRG33x02_171870, partial [Trema orientale]
MLPTKLRGATTLPTPAKWGGNQKKNSAQVYGLCSIGVAVVPHCKNPMMLT